jgi:hypothetical protein
VDKPLKLELTSAIAADLSGPNDDIVEVVYLAGLSKTSREQACATIGVSQFPIQQTTFGQPRNFEETGFPILLMGKEEPRFTQS